MREDSLFRDESELRACGGKGGAGCCSFLREKYQPWGGPDGGDGGDGGDVILKAAEHEGSLYSVARRRTVQAEDGEPGGTRNRHGRSGADAIVLVPPGTVVRDRRRGNVLADLDAPGKSVVVARGGRGGRGNARFATATNQSPRTAEPGEPGEERELQLELKLVADVGLVGLPNSGKSTLLRALTAARPRVAGYPFTTLHPCLGILETGDPPAELVLADIPGLVAGAHAGRGLGLQFLRHVERTRLLLHLVDCSALAPGPCEALRTVQTELATYSAALAERPRVVLATKVEDPDSERRAAGMEEALGAPLLRISAHTGRGLDLLRQTLVQRIRSLRAAGSRGGAGGRGAA